MKIGKREVKTRSFLVFLYCVFVMYGTYDSIWWGVTAWLSSWGVISHFIGVLAERKKRKYLTFFIISIFVYPLLTAFVMYFVDPYLR